MTVLLAWVFIILLFCAGCFLLYSMHKDLEKIRAQQAAYDPAKVIMEDIESSLFIVADDPMHQKYFLSHDGTKQLVPVYDVDTLQQMYDVLQDHFGTCHPVSYSSQSS